MNSREQSASLSALLSEWPYHQRAPALYLKHLDHIKADAATNRETHECCEAHNEKILI